MAAVVFIGAFEIVFGIGIYLRPYQGLVVSVLTLISLAYQHQRLYCLRMKSKAPPKESQPRSKRLLEIIAKSGGVTEMSRQLGITQGAVSQWREVPLRRVVKVAKMLRMSLHDVRPDVF